jgi:hypothetical protein
VGIIASPTRTPGLSPLVLIRWYSKIRQVPDNQEVWMDQDGYTSIIFDITERVGRRGGDLETDGQALTTHLEDIVGDDIGSIKVWNSSATQFSRLE